MSNRNDPFWAVPVYVVAPPVERRGSFQNNLDAAIPVFFTAMPTTYNAGAIPVRVVGGTGPGPTWPNDRSDAGAIPVYEDPIGVPVWRV